MPIAQLAAGLALLFLVAVTMELAETFSRMGRLDLRSGSMAAAGAPVGSGNSLIERAGGVALTATVIWFYALPWVAGAGVPAGALLLVLAMCAVGVVLLGRIRHAAVRYPAAATAPVLLVAAATAWI